MTRHYLCLFAGILLTGLAQILLRMGARQPDAGLIARMLQPKIVLGYGLFFGVTLLNVFAMQAIELRVMTAWSSLTYVWVMLLSGVCLRERITGRMVWGCGLIVVGVLVFSLTSH
jgi:drug/metabolite transporter (DMT)-like permease